MIHPLLTSQSDAAQDRAKMTLRTGIRPPRRTTGHPGLCLWITVCWLATTAPLVQGHLYFLPFLHAPRVHENATAGTYIVTIAAKDDDGNQHISYSLLKGGDMFQVENTTGQLSTRHEVRRKAGETYQLLLVAVSADETQSVPMTVTVTRVNRYAPQFSQPVYTVELSSHSPVNTTVLVVTATDPDPERDNSEVFYFLAKQSVDVDGSLTTVAAPGVPFEGVPEASTDGYFSIDPRTGVLALRKPLPDRPGRLHAMVVVSDGGSPKRTNTTWVDVHVKTIPAPRNVTADNATATNVRVCWLRPRDDALVNGYLVWYGPANGSGPGSEHTLNMTIEEPAPQHCIYVNSLRAATNYKVRVAGWNAEETGIKSEAVRFNTSVPRCSPENLCGNGTCNPRPGSAPKYWCSCYVGFYGEHCEHYNPCSSSPCKNLGTCQNTSDGQYQCSCLTGFSGPDCADFDPCANQQAIDCQNGGTCSSNGSHEYKCHCPQGFYGPMCQWFDPCSSTNPPCLHESTCRNESNEMYTCLCRPGFEGEHCEVDIDECASSPCQNGGTCRQSIAKYSCMCPFHFQGPSCEEPVKCQAETLQIVGQDVLFQTTAPGNNISVSCPYGPDNAIVVRSCTVQRDGVKWGPAEAGTCQERGLQMADRTTKKLRIMTSNPMMLESDDIKNITGEIEDILDYAISNQQIALDMMTVISNLLDANDTAFDSEEANTSSNRLSHVIDRFISEVYVTDELKIQTDNLMVHVLMTNVSDAGVLLNEGEGLGPSSYSSHEKNGLTLIGLPPKSPMPYDGNDTTTIPELTVSKAALRLGSSGTHPRPRVHFVAHSNAKLYREFHHPSALDRHTPSNRPVFVVNLANTTVANVSGGVTFTMRKPLRGKWICAFWDSYKNGSGRWSKVGLSSEQDDQDVMCTSEHMTAFSILLDPEPDMPMDDRTSKNLSIISYIGSGLSIVGLLLTILTYSLFRSLNRDRHGKILLNLCVSMLLLNVSFLAGAFRSDPSAADVGLDPDFNRSQANQSVSGVVIVHHDDFCTSIAVLSHYFLLATFMWMSIEATNMYQLLVYVFNTAETHFLLKRCLIAWGVPLIIVGITAAADISDYNYDNQTCLLSARDPYAYYFALFGPCCLLLLANTVVFGLVTRILFQPRQTVRLEEKGGRKSSFDTVTFAQVRGAFTVMVLLGVAWVFGALAVGPVRVLFQYLFCVLNSLQGFLLFAVRCLQYPEARAAWLQLFRTGTRKKYRGSKVTTSSNSHTKPSGGAISAAGSSSAYSNHTRSTFDGNGNGMHPITGTVFTRNVPGVTSSGALSWSKSSSIQSPAWVYGGTAEKREKLAAPTEDSKEGRDTCWEYHNINTPDPTEARGPWVPETAPMRLSAVGGHDLPFIEDETEGDREEEEADISAEIKVKRRNRANKVPLSKTESHSDQGYSTGEHPATKKKPHSAPASPTETIEFRTISAATDSQSDPGDLLTESSES